TVGTGVSPGRVVAVGGGSVGDGVIVGCAALKSLNDATCTPVSPSRTANCRAAANDATEHSAVPPTSATMPTINSQPGMLRIHKPQENKRLALSNWLLAKG